MGISFSATARNKLPTTAKTKKSTIRKALLKSERQTGMWAIRTRPVPSIKAQDSASSQKTSRRVLRASVGRALDMQGIFDKETRKLVQQGVQKLHNTKTKEEERIEAIKMRKTLRSLTTDEYRLLMQNILKTQTKNLELLNRLRKK